MTNPPQPGQIYHNPATGMVRASNDHSNDCLVRLPEVKRRTGLSRATIYRKVGRGEFPRKVQLSANVVAWYESDIAAWVADPMGWARRAA